MAWDHERSAVAGARLRYGPRGGRPAYRLCYLPVGPRAPVGNRLQLLPDSPLERRRLYIQWEVQAQPLSTQIGHGRRYPFANLDPSVHEHGSRKLLAQTRDKLRFSITQANGANPFVG